jgi:hypothetical protein
VDPSASERLFCDEVGAMRGQAVFSSGGWKIVSGEFPDLVVELPHPSGARRRFRLRCDSWDELPPSVKSVDANGNQLDGEPKEGLFMGLNTGWGLCAPGTREYHAHHTDNPWANHRGGVWLAAIVVRVASHYRQATP